MQALLDWLGSGFTAGRLEFAAPDGRTWTLGRGQRRARLRLRSASVLRRMLAHPALRFGEAYMDGDWEPDGCDLREVLSVALAADEALHARRNPLSRGLHRARAHLRELNSPLRSRHNVAHHYDLDFELYRHFLDADLHYSCAYFQEPSLSLEAAQQAKCAFIARKLQLRPGMRVLDIGCGWGSLAMYLAAHHDVHVTGITLSGAQHEQARLRARERDLADRTEFRLEDYRDTRGPFDAIVSVGMFEHVGRPQYARYFDRIAELLSPDGVALVHTIGRLSPPNANNPWIEKYIFPGGYIPAASEMLPSIEDSGLLLTDLEIWRHHYAHTLHEWHRRFEQWAPHLPPQFDARFRRMWRFYLQGSEACFLDGRLCVFHCQLTHRMTRLPDTRDYLYR